MSNHKQATELHKLMGIDLPPSGAEGARLDQAALTAGLEDDTEKLNGAVPVPAPPLPPPEIMVSAASPGPGLGVDGDDNKPGFFGKLKRYLLVQLKKPALFWHRTDKRTMLTASSCFLTVMMLCAMISLAIVAVHGSKIVPSPSVARAVQLFHAPVPVIHASNVEQRDRFDTYLSSDGNKALSMMSTIGDTCDDATVSVQPLAITMTNNVNATSTLATMMQSTSIMPASVDVLTLSRPSAAPSMVTAATSSLSTLAPSSSCLEYGDGAGPCARPYGHPNSTPESWMSSLMAESVGDASTFPVGMSTSLFPVGVPAMASSNAFTSSFTDASLSSLIEPSATIDASLCQPTTTVYVTITADSKPDNNGNTVFATSTSLSTLTSTISGSDGPLTTTETVAAAAITSSNINNNNGTSGQKTVVAVNGTGGLMTTLDVPSYTLTLHTTVGPNGTVFHSASPTAPGPVVANAGEQLTAPKPLGMGASSSSGNGVYCLVMLVALLALLG